MSASSKDASPFAPASSSLPTACGSRSRATSPTRPRLRAARCNGSSARRARQPTALSCSSSIFPTRAGSRPTASRPWRRCVSPAPCGWASASRERPTSPPTAACRAAAGLVLTALLDGGLGNWRNAPADITATIDSPDVTIGRQRPRRAHIRCTDARHGTAGGRDLPQGRRYAGEGHDDVGRRQGAGTVLRLRRARDHAGGRRSRPRWRAARFRPRRERCHGRGRPRLGRGLERDAHRRHHQARIRQSCDRIEAAAAQHRRQPRRRQRGAFLPERGAGHRHRADRRRRRDRAGAARSGARPQAGGGGAGRRAADRRQDHLARAWVRFQRPRRHRGQAQRRLRHAIAGRGHGRCRTRAPRSSSGPARSA